MRIAVSAGVLMLSLWMGVPLPALGQDTGVLRLPGPPPLALPAWLAPVSQAQDRSGKATATEAISSYKAPIPAAAVVAYYERQLQAAGVAFQTRPDGTGASIEASTEKTAGTVRVHGEEGGARVEVSYTLRPDPPPAPATPAPPAPRVLEPLLLEWPDWLDVPDARLVLQWTNPPGRIGRGLTETCPGDVIGKPSQGCLERVYESSDSLKDLYEYFSDLLQQHGYDTHGSGAQPYANLDLGKFDAAPFASLTVREYPVPQEAASYRQLNIFLRQPGTPVTKVEIAFLVRNPPGVEAAASQAARNVTGAWTFTQVAGRFGGTVVLQQSGSAVTGTWHTAAGKVEPDSKVSGQVNGNTVYLTRTFGDLKQEYVLTVSADGDQLDGYGEGWGIQHANLNLRRTVAARSPRALSRTIQ